MPKKVPGEELFEKGSRVPFLPRNSARSRPREERHTVLAKSPLKIEIFGVGQFSLGMDRPPPGHPRASDRRSAGRSFGQPQRGAKFYSSPNKSGSFRPIAPKLTGRMVLVVSYHAHRTVSRCVERPRNESRLLFSGFDPRQLGGKRSDGLGAPWARGPHGGPHALRTASPCDENSGSCEGSKFAREAPRGRVV